MSSKSTSPTSKQTIVYESQETNASFTKLIEPISTVPPSKPKRRTSTKFASKKKKPSKSKRGESKTPMSMAGMYEKENPFLFTIVEPNVGTSEKDPENVDAEVTVKIAPDVASSEVEKGNLDETITSEVYESGRKLGLEDLNAAIDSTENMDIDNPQTGVENIVDESAQTSPEQAFGQRMLGWMLEHLWTNRTSRLIILLILLVMSQALKHPQKRKIILEKWV